MGVKDEAFLADWRGDAEIDSALELVEAGKYTEAQLEAYHRSLDRARLETTLLGDAEAKGMAQGMAEGEAKGEAAATARLVQALRAGGMSAEQISGITKVALANVQHALRK